MERLKIREIHFFKVLITGVYPVRLTFTCYMLIFWKVIIEINQLKKFNNKNKIKYYDDFIENDYIYLVLEYCEV